jgi:tetratricopeptide (TPR) repeat protein
MQRGDRAALERALDVFERSTSEMQHAELSWHCARMRVIERLNRGPLQDLSAQLAALRERGANLQLFAYDQVCRHDLLVLLRQTMEPAQLAKLVPSPSLPVPEDPPAIVAMKLRGAVNLGFRDAARAGLLELSRRGLEKLPCDRDFLGVLNHLALTAVALDEHEPIAALLSLLRPHADYYAADIGIHCDGSVAYALGQMTRMLGKRDEACQYFEHAIARNERFELPARAAESRYELAATLLKPATAGNRKRARELLAKAHEAASALGLSVLRARANALSNEL